MLTQTRLKELFTYESETGLFTRKIRTSRSTKVGEIAGCINGNGYSVISIDNKLYLSHRMAWLYSHGEWPKKFIDHINGDKTDNRLCNLREASHAENLQNLKRGYSGSKSNYLGIVWNNFHNKWQARIKVDGKTKHIGYFHSEEEARDAYLSHKRILHPFCTI